MRNIRLSNIVFSIILLMLATGCTRNHILHSKRYEVHGVDGVHLNGTIYTGAISGNPEKGTVDVTIRTHYNSVYCTGSLYRGAYDPKNDFPGEGFLSCRDGRALAVGWKALSSDTGVALGVFSDKRVLHFTYGFDSPAASTAALRAHYNSLQKDKPKPAPDGKPDDKPGGNEPETVGGPGGSGQGEAGKTPGGATPPKTPDKPERKPEVEGRPSEAGNGSGFFVNDDGLLITNYHVVENAAGVWVEDTFSRKVYKARVLATDPVNDLAVVKIDAKTKAVPLGDSKTVRKGDDVLALGYPQMHALGEEQKASFGRIMSLSGHKGDIRYFHSDATIHGGNSGGPLFNDRGEVIGVNSLGVSSEYMIKAKNILTDVNWAVKSDYVKALLAALPHDYKPLGRKGSKAANMTELVGRCERSVVIVWTKEAKGPRSK